MNRLCQVRVHALLLTVFLVVYSVPASAATLTGAKFTAPPASTVTGAQNTRYDWGFTTATAATLSRVALSVPPGTSGANRYLALSGATHNHTGTPDSAANSVTGDLDLRVNVAMATWTPAISQTLINKRLPGQTSYQFRIEANGALTVVWSNDGTAINSTSSTLGTGFAPNTKHWVRVALRPNNGAGGSTTTFYTSENGNDWTQLGVVRIGVTPGAIFDSTTDITVGNYAGVNSSVQGAIYNVEIRNGINGTVVNRLDPNESNSASPSSWSSSTGETWTIYRSGTSLRADIASTLDVGSIVGLPPGGAAVLRLIDGVALYTLPTPTAVSSGTAVSINLGGFNNTLIAGNYTSTITTYNSAGPPAPVDSRTTASLSFIITEPPTVAPDGATTDEDTPISIDVLANDSDPDESLLPASVTMEAAPIHGATTINASNGRINYTPDVNWFGTDSFTYGVCDNKGACGTALTAITVDSVNDAPVAVANTASVPEDETTSVDVLANDTDIDGTLDAATLAIVTPPQHGSAVVDAAAIAYSPGDNYTGADTLIYQVCDNEGLCGTASAAITVLAVNDPPGAVDDFATTNEDTQLSIDPLANDGDVEQLDTSSLQILVQPTHGAANVANTRIGFTPAPNYFGSDALTYRVCDSEGLCDTAVANIAVVSVNDAPRINGDTAAVTAGQSVSVDVLSNDSDIDGTLVAGSVEVTTAGTMGAALVDKETGAVTFSPYSSTWGFDSLTYRACDNGGACATASVSITVSPVPVTRAVETVIKSPPAAKQVAIPGINQAAITPSPGPITTYALPATPPTQTLAALAGSLPEQRFTHAGEARSLEPPRESFIQVGEGVAPLSTTLSGAKFTVASGRLPPGLSVGADGRFIGTPSEPGEYRFSVTACNDYACETFELKLIVAASADGNSTALWAWILVGAALTSVSTWLVRHLRRKAR